MVETDMNNKTAIKSLCKTRSYFKSFKPDFSDGNKTQIGKCLVKMLTQEVT